MDSKTELFLRWLDSNDVVYHKIDWPTYHTESGMRGAIARQDIATNEDILVIPHSIMMTPLHAYR
jgi:hypothetical protein